MTTCPNCGRPITDDDKVCPNCKFNLEKYRETFFTDQHQKAKKEDPDMAAKIASRAAYRQEFYPKKQNSTVQKMIKWIRSNATIVFLLGVLLLIIMSFSRSLGWIGFLILMVWLFILCDRRDHIEEYTSDRRLTEKINQLASNTFNAVENHGQKARAKGKKFDENHPHVEESKKRKKHHFSYIQISVVLTSFMQ